MRVSAHPLVPKKIVVVGYCNLFVHEQIDYFSLMRPQKHLHHDLASVRCFRPDSGKPLHRDAAAAAKEVGTFRRTVYGLCSTVNFAISTREMDWARRQPQ